MISLAVAGRAAFVDSQLLTALRVTPSALANLCCDMPAIRRALRIRSANAITHPLDPSKPAIMARCRVKDKPHDSGTRQGSNIVSKPPVPLAMPGNALLRGPSRFDGPAILSDARAWRACTANAAADKVRRLRMPVPWMGFPSRIYRGPQWTLHR
jgi:hypothetical protein